MRKLPLLFVSAAICALLTGCVEPQGEVSKVPGTSSTPGEPASSTPTTAVEEVIASVGETLDYNGLQISLNAVENYAGGGEFATDTPDEGKTFVVLRFTAQNNTDADEFINMFYEDSYCNDTAIDPESLMWGVEGDEFWGDVAAGKKREGYVCYQVPNDWKQLEFYYKPTGFLNGAKMKFVVTPDDLA